LHSGERKGKRQVQLIGRSIHYARLFTLNQENCTKFSEFIGRNMVAACEERSGSFFENNLIY